MWILPHLPLCSITNIPPFSSPSCQFPVEFSRISIKSVFPCVNIPSKSAAFHKTAPVLLAPDFKKISLLSFQSPFPPPRFANISLSRPQQTASHRAQPKPPCGRFSAACGRCGGAAAPPGLRPKAPSPPAPPKAAKKHRPGPIRAPGRHPRQRRVSRSDFQPPAFRCGSRPASAGCSDSRSDCRFWHCSGNFYSRFSPPFQGIVCARRSPLIPKNREDLPPGKIPPAPSHSGK